MTESTPSLRYPAVHDESYIVALVPTDLDIHLGTHLNRIHSRPVWPNLAQNPEYSDLPIEQTATAHVLGYVCMNALTLQSSPRLEKERLKLDVVDYDAALNGLWEYYGELRKTRDQKHKNALLGIRTEVLRTTGNKYAEPYVLMRLRQSLKRRPLIPGLRPDQSDFITSRSLVDIAGALGTTIMTASRHASPAR